MAEFINSSIQKQQRASDAMTKDAMNAFGNPVPYYRRIAAEEHCKQMGLNDAEKITGMIQRACECVERDRPYEVMEAITAYLDLTGAYRLLAVLCTAPSPAEANEPPPKRIKSGPKDGPDNMQVYHDFN